MALIAMFQDCLKLKHAPLAVIAPEVEITPRFCLALSDSIAQSPDLKHHRLAPVAIFAPATPSRRRFADLDTFVLRVPRTS